LSSVTRIHILKTENSRYIPISSDFAFEHPANDSLFSAVEPEIITTDTYQWYEEGYRYPVFETIETYRMDSTEKIPLSKDAYFYHPAEQAYLPEDTANQVVLERKHAARNAKKIEKESNILSFGCHPNPARDHLDIEFALREAAAAEIIVSDIYGRVYAHFPLKKPATWYNQRLDLHIFPPGYYLVKVFTGKETASEKIKKI